MLIGYASAQSYAGARQIIMREFTGASTVFMRNVLLCAVLGLAPVALPALAAVNINIDIDVAPPAPRYEAVPAPRSGYVWAPGYWQWDGQRHVWARGRWVEARPGAEWVADRWEPRDGRHYYEPGHWKEKGKPKKAKKVKHKDKDHDKGKGHDR